MDATGSTMGRPPIGTKQYQVQLEPQQVARIDAVTAAKGHQRSAFIREAIERMLAERETDGGNDPRP